MRERQKRKAPASMSCVGMACRISTTGSGLCKNHSLNSARSPRAKISEHVMMAADEKGLADWATGGRSERGPPGFSFLCSPGTALPVLRYLTESRFVADRIFSCWRGHRTSLPRGGKTPAQTEPQSRRQLPSLPPPTIRPMIAPMPVLAPTFEHHPGELLLLLRPRNHCTRSTRSPIPDLTTSAETVCDAIRID